jgi:hypothetical protein
MPDFAAEIETVLTEVTAIMGRTITLRKVGRNSTLLVSGTITRTESNQDQTLNANLTSERMVPQSAGFSGGGGGEHAVLERVYELQLSAVTIGTPAKTWRVVDGSDIFEINRIDADCDSKNLILTCRRSV